MKLEVVTSVTSTTLEPNPEALAPSQVYQCRDAIKFGVMGAFRNTHTGCIPATIIPIDFLTLISVCVLASGPVFE